MDIMLTTSKKNFSKYHLRIYYVHSSYIYCVNNLLLRGLLFFILGFASMESLTQNIPEDALFLENSNRIMKKIRDFNYFELMNHVSHERGLRFSPYANIDTINDVQLSPQEIKAVITSKESIHWGSFDGSGDSINMSFAKYHQKFVYDVDFLNAEKIEIDQFIGSGNSLNNLQTAYPNCRFVEYHFSGFDEKYDKMDWRSLRLVFKKEKAKYYLVGIIHAQWTI